MHGLDGSVLNFKEREGGQKCDRIVAFNVTQMKWHRVTGYNIWWVMLI